jgi:quercetin dioxygenase-like cupin family protein
MRLGTLKHSPPLRIERVRARLMQSLPGGRRPRVTAHEEGWTHFAPAIELKALRQDGTQRSWLLRLGPGTELPDHEHPEGDEECLVLEGSLAIDGRLLRAGDYQLVPRGVRHGRMRSDEGCVLFIRSPLPRA